VKERAKQKKFKGGEFHRKGSSQNKTPKRALIVLLKKKIEGQKENGEKRGRIPVLEKDPRIVVGGKARI